MAEVYEMLMRMGVKNEVSSALLAISQQMVGIHNLVGTISSGFGGWKLAIGAVGTVLVGGTIIKSLEEIAKHGALVNHEFNLMKVAGMTASEMQEASIAASKTSGAVLTTTYAENLKHVNELRAAFGETSDAIKHLDEISKANAILGSLKGGGTDQVWELVKALEGKGLTYDEKEFNSYVNTMMKVVEATGGRVTPSAFQSAFKYGRTATLGWDEQFVGGALGRLIQEMTSGGGGGGGTGGPGNALMSAYGAVVSGKMGKTAAKEFESVGLGKSKHLEGDEAEVIGDRGQSIMQKNPYEWVQKVLMPALTAHGFTTQEQIQEQVGKMFENRTAGHIMTMMALQGRANQGERSPFEKDIKVFGTAMGTSGYDELIKNDYPTIMRAFHQQWKNLLETIGGPLMAPGGPVINALSGLVTVMGSMSQWAAANPESMKLILAAMGSLAAAFILMTGSAVMAGAIALAPGGVVAAALIAVVGFLASIGTFKKVNDAIDGIITGFNRLVDGIINFGIKFGEAIGSVFSSIGRFFDLSRFLKKTSTEGTGPADKMFVPTRFDPGKPASGTGNPISLALNIDGRTLAQAISDVLTDKYAFPTGAPAPDGRRAWSDVDHNYTAV
jgi:hypothetical protein